jgi:hypothetical protein
MRKRKPAIRYSKALADFICEKIEDGLCVAEIVRKYGPKTRHYKVPTEATIYRWRRVHAEFKKAYDIAYQTFVYAKIDEMYSLMNQGDPTVEEIKKVIGDPDPHPSIVRAYISAHQQKKRLKIDTLKFIAAKLAPKLVPELSDKLDVKHNVDNKIQIIMPDWSLTSDQLKKPKIIDQEGDILLDKDDE